MSDEKKLFGIADYLEQFDKSPYSYPACDFTPLPGVVSEVKGSWFQEKPVSVAPET
jgi:hypothetical protein